MHLLGLSSGSNATPWNTMGQLSDVACLEHRDGARPGSIEICVVMYRWASCLPRNRMREKKTSAAGEDSKPVEKKAYFMT